MDVDLVMQGFLRGAQKAGVQIVTGVEILSVERSRGRWRLSTTAGSIVCDMLVDAAGAWADEFATLAGAAPLGLAPQRRTAILFDPPPNSDSRRWPMVMDAEERFYFKPDAGQIFASPCDQTPSPPMDAWPEDMDVAICVDRIERATKLKVRQVARTWAGMRTVAPDHVPVVGFHPQQEGFFWLAGQGGYGVQTAPAIADMAAAIIMGADPDGVPYATACSPARFMRG